MRRCKSVNSLSRGTILAVLVSLLSGQVTPGIIDGQSPAESNTARALELLVAARKAMGSDPQSLRPRTLIAKGRSRRFIRYVAVKSPTKVEERERELSGRFEYDFALPDRFRIWMKGQTLGGYGFKFEEIVNGDSAWRNPPLNVRSFNRDRRVIDVGDVERTLLMQAQSARQQATFQSLGLLALTPPSYPLRLHEAGVFRQAGENFNLVLSETPDGLKLSLLFDPKTGLLVGLVTAYVDTFQEAVVAEVSSVDRRFIAATYARAREERLRRRHSRRRQEVVWRFADHRPVGGLLIPHRSEVYFNGSLIEENTITSLRIDRPIDDDRFAGEERVRY